MRTISEFATFLLLAIAIFAPTTALAHASHGEPLTEAQSIEFATRYVKTVAADPALAADWGLDESWQQATAGTVVSKTVRSLVVSVINSQTNTTLYVLMDGNGGIYDANFSGEFEGRK